MIPAVISLIAFACIFLGALLGLFLRTVLPEHHLSALSRYLTDEGIDAERIPEEETWRIIRLIRSKLMP